MQFARSALVAGALVAVACGGSGRADGAAGDTAWATAAELAVLAPPPDSALRASLADGERKAMDVLPAGAGRALVVGQCLVCHSATMIVQQHKDSAAWTRTVTQMAGWGASVDSAQQGALVAYLSLRFPQQ
jgi:hypothetical protein